jgi:hypothetical protein
MDDSCMGCSAGDEHKRGGIGVLERIERAARVHARKDARSGGSTTRNCGLWGSIGWQATRSKPYKNNELKCPRRRWASSRRSRGECMMRRPAKKRSHSHMSQCHGAVYRTEKMRHFYGGHVPGTASAPRHPSPAASLSEGSPFLAPTLLSL